MSHEPTSDDFRTLLAHRPRSSAYVKGRVVLVCGSLGPGGAERQVVYTLMGLARSGLESVQLVCDELTPGRPEKYDFYLPQLEQAGIAVRMIRPGRVPASGNQVCRALAAHPHGLSAALIEDVANLYLELQELRPEVVHAWLDSPNVRAGLAAAMAGVPRIVLAGRNVNPSHFALYQPGMRQAYTVLTELPNIALVNNSHAGAVDYAAWLGIPTDNVKVIHNGIDFQGRGRASLEEIAQVRANLRIPQDAIVVGGAFRLCPEKEPLLWVKVAAEVASRCPEAWFVLYGQGVLGEQVESLAARLGILPRLILPGVTSEILQALSAMDVLLLTSRQEGLPNVLLEAQLVGTPVVTTDAGGAAEAVEPGLTGWIVREREKDTIAEHVLWLLANPLVRQRAQAAGPESVQRRFGVGRMIEETLQLYGVESSGTRTFA